MTFCIGTYKFKNRYLPVSFLKENFFSKIFFLFFIIALPWIRSWFQIEPKSWIQIQIQCIWIHTTASWYLITNQSKHYPPQVMLLPRSRRYLYLNNQSINQSNIYWYPSQVRLQPPSHTYKYLNQC